MQNISGRSRSESNCSSSRQNDDFESDFNVFGLDDVSYLSLYLDTCKEDYKLINYVNSNVNFLNYIYKYNLNLLSTNKSDWDFKCNCPFPDHRDSSPSFYINSKLNKFNCFGCSRKGGICQFIAILQNKQTIDVAKEFIKNEKISTSELIKEFQESYIEKISAYLDKFAELHFSFLQKNNFSEEALKYAEIVAPAFEFYIKSSLKNRNINMDSLDLRLNFCARKFEEFEK